MKPRSCRTAQARILHLRITTLALAIFIGGFACAAPETMEPPGEDSRAAAPAESEPTSQFDLTGTPVQSREGKSLGTVYFPTSCASEAQEHLDRGLALLHHMTYVAAEAEFRAAGDLDPECAMAHWGVAMTFVHPLWPDVVPSEKLVEGLALLDRAAQAGHTSEREQAYARALRSYYEPGIDEPSELDRLSAFLEGWTHVHQSYPEDMEAASFHALSLLGTASTTDKTYANQRQAGAIAQAILVELPQHPGGHHYTIHAFDFPPLAEDALATARSYDDVAPENSHALHMTSHIFTRRGLWPESIEFNIRAERAARERTPSGTISMHRLHAMDYLAYAYLQMADDVKARSVLTAMVELAPPFQNHAGTAYSFAAVPARLPLERHAWEEAAAVEPAWPADLPWEQYPHLLAIPYFARAMGTARTGDFSAAEAAIAKLSTLEDAARNLPGAYDWGIQVEIQKLSASAWLALEQGENEKALALMAEAASKEASTEKNPVTPGEVLPARELYGDMLLATGDYVAALAEYRAALERSPNRFNSLFGAGRAAELAGDDQTASDYYRQLLAIAPEATGERPALDHAVQYLNVATS